MDIVRMKCAQATSDKSLKFIAGESMPKIILNEDDHIRTGKIEP